MPNSRHLFEFFLLALVGQLGRLGRFMNVFFLRRRLPQLPSFSRLRLMQLMHLCATLSFYVGLQIAPGVVYAQSTAANLSAPKLYTFSDTMEQRVKACVACHGLQGRSTSAGYFPRIAGKPSGYLLNQLINFREQRRRYPFMNYIVAHLSDDYLREMAEYFSEQNPPYAMPAPISTTNAVVDMGKQLVLRGDMQRGLPACIACHGERITGIAPFVPGLLGLPRDYLVAQLGAWQSDNRRTLAPDCMAQIAKKLKPAEIEAISTWLAMQAVPTMSKAEPADSRRQWPMKCGSNLP